MDAGLTIDETKLVRRALLTDENPRHLYGLAGCFTFYPASASFLHAKGKILEAKGQGCGTGAADDLAGCTPNDSALASMWKTICPKGERCGYAGALHIAAITRLREDLEASASRRKMSGASNAARVLAGQLVIDPFANVSDVRQACPEIPLLAASIISEIGMLYVIAPDASHAAFPNAPHAPQDAAMMEGRALWIEWSRRQAAMLGEAW